MLDGTKPKSGVWGEYWRYANAVRVAGVGGASRVMEAPEFRGSATTVSSRQPSISWGMALRICLAADWEAAGIQIPGPQEDCAAP